MINLSVYSKFLPLDSGLLSSDVLCKSVRHGFGWITLDYQKRWDLFFISVIFNWSKKGRYCLHYLEVWWLHINSHYFLSFQIFFIGFFYILVKLKAVQISILPRINIIIIFTWYFINGFKILIFIEVKLFEKHNKCVSSY